jgi:TPR repeat protein
MRLRSLLMLRSNLLSLLAVLCLWPAISAEAKPDTLEERPASLAEVQTKAAKGFVKQELELAADYFVGRGVPKDLTQSAYWYRKAADQGNPPAQLYLGYMYTVGMGVPQDKAEAVRWYRRASSSNYPEAKVNLAALYMRGDGVKQDPQEALRLLKSADEKGDGRADAYLGLASYLGSGVPVDFAAAEAWFKLGVKRHDAEAECFLAALDANEPGRVPNIPEEDRLLRLSADGGYLPGIHALGLLLVNHPDLPQAPQEATNLLLLAAGSGSWQSSVILGVLARDGRLVPKDQRAAYRWFRIAASQGGSAAEAYLRPELQRMAARVGDTAPTEQEASAWLQVHPHHDLFVFGNELNPKYFPIQEVYATAHAPAVDSEVGNQSERPN